ncbi:MAG TPA: cytochrome c oxidase subunit 3 [Symbiobacteriaceae bacterium]|nr:cytochrome c oxidase subunit 3 [Symbiobacteriaceae bacterium]
MAHDIAQAHGHEAAATNTGITNRKLAFWLFLASECVFFASLLIGFLVYGDKTNGGPGMELFNINLTTISTFVLLMSSLAMVLGVNASQRGLARDAMKWILATAVMGQIFLGFQVYEFWHFVHEGFGLTTSPLSTAFFVLTGFHGAHVFVGILWLLSLLWHGRRGGLTAEKSEAVEVGGLYWHFVDVVWIVIFTVIYLLPKVH